MSDHEDLVNGEPPPIDPYEVLGLERTASPEQVKSAYRKAALKNHPDKVPEDRKAQAHSAFQSIAFAYAVLSDPRRRKKYDATGSTSESIVDADGFNWSDFYREQFADAISSDAIEKFAKQYKNSDEEKDDVLIAYEHHKGDMDKIYQDVMLSNVLVDDERFRTIIGQAIESGDVKSYKAYTKETKASRAARLKSAKAEATEAVELARELGVHDKLFGGRNTDSKDKRKEKNNTNSEDALAALIRGNQHKRGESFLESLAERYGATSKGKKSKRLDEEPSEEAFQAAAARLGLKNKAAEPADVSKPRKKVKRP